jgi:YVTN family beta-propeller protein
MAFHPAKFLGFTSVLAIAIATAVGCRTQAPHFSGVSPKELVGRIGTNAFYTPANQILTPAGMQVDLAGMRPQALALGRNGQLYVGAARTHALIVVDPVTGKILQRVPLPSDNDKDPSTDTVSTHILEPDTEGQVSFTGLAVSPDGTRIYLSNVRGSIKVFGVEHDGKVVGLFSISLPPATAPERKAEIPAGIAVSPDGKKLYVALNLSNRLVELDASDGKVLRTWEVGVAPYDVVLAGNKIYVSNWGGRRPDAQSLTGPAGRGTMVRVDPVRHIANEGSVSVIYLNGEPAREILTGLHASALAVTPNGRHLVVCNAGSDTLSVIDTRTDVIVETLWARQKPSDLFGAQPNALAFDSSGKKLFVCNGTQNAVAVFDFKPGKSELRGLIPVGWFPAAIAYDAKRKALCVANIKGLPLKMQKDKESGGTGFNTHQYHGTLSIVPVPSSRVLSGMTQVSLHNMRYGLLQQAKLPARPGQPPRPVPERVGEPSVFKHVIYIIKENRTYDQVLGDVREGNGDPSLCIFGERVTPNQHKLVRDFVLLDNTYCSGILSADGHQWANSAITTEYLERSFASFPRSYPDGMGDDEVDALAYSPAGFIWDNAIAHGKTLRNYGEFAITEKRWKDQSRKGKLTFLEHYRDFTSAAGAIEISSRPAIESLRPYLVTNTVGWDMDIPDVWRAQKFIEDLKMFNERGEFPNLTIICLPNDHTSGNEGRFAHPCRASCRQRSRVWPNRRSCEPEQVLERNVHLRHRGRSTKRLGSRQRLSHDGLCHQPLHSPRRGS